VLVETFLRSLGSDKLLDVMKEGQLSKEGLNDLLAGYVSFTHFLYVTYSVEESDLRECFARSAAIICKRNETAIDLIIPVLLAADKMSYISVQVKNYSEVSRKPEAELRSFFHQGTLSLVGEVPYLVLLMQVGKTKKPDLYCFHRKSAESSTRSASKQTGEASTVETLIVETEKTGESSTPEYSAKPTRSSTLSTGITKSSERLHASKKQKTIPTEPLPAAQDRPTKREPDGVLVTMNGIAGAIYPFLENRQLLVDYLTQLSICWTDPIMYGKSSDPFDTKFALRSWYRTSHKWDKAENWKKS
jgi:hypothetical protein